MQSYKIKKKKKTAAKDQPPQEKQKNTDTQPGLNPPLFPWAHDRPQRSEVHRHQAGPRLQVQRCHHGVADAEVFGVQRKPRAKARAESGRRGKGMGVGKWGVLARN